ncbi:hypothetical protein ACFQY0_07185 [Haloferula chungangensis]|uniref:SLA1 homology domain-containing protein n=1 Tax=Haloferula chungangensis TaxID=1048331 RepID=A0ABW2L5W5_9BACT
MKSLLVLILPLLMNPVFGRSWTNTEGRVIEADLIGVKGDKVVLSMKGKEYEIPLASLSEEDQTFAQEEVDRLEKERLESAKKFMGQELVPGQTITFEFPLSPENQELAKNRPKGWKDSFAGRYGGDWIKKLGEPRELSTINVYLGVPKNFDPVKGCPVFVQWTTSDRQSNVAGAKSYWDTCNEKGWMLVSVDGAPDSKALWTNAVFLAGIKEFFEQLHAKYPGSEQWTIATGGFSGGSKICQWMGGLMSGLEGVDVKGYWIGGCNEARFDYAAEDLDVSKKAYRSAKAYISSGESDRLVNKGHRDEVEKGCKEGGFAEVRSEVYSGGHSISQEQFAEALDWFLE